MKLLLALILSTTAVYASPTVLERTHMLESFDRQCPPGEAISSLALTKYKGDIGLFVVCEPISDDGSASVSVVMFYVRKLCA